MTTFFPNTGSETEWNAAYYRLEDYLRALHVVNKLHQSQIILRLLQAAAVRHAADSGQSPTTIALHEAQAAIDQWCERVLRQQERGWVNGRISLLITDAAEKWPALFLANEIPSDFERVMQESQVQAGPDLQVSSMVPRPIDDINPLVGGLFPDHWDEVERGAVLVAVAVASAAIALLFFVFN